MGVITVLISTAAGSVIGPGSVLTDAVIGKNCIVKNTYITESTLEENVSIGPFSQVRPGCHIAAGCKIGDFVEVKNSHIGQKTAIAIHDYFVESKTRRDMILEETKDKYDLI